MSPVDSWELLRESKPALSYIVAFSVLRDIARECGYALALHGSLARDFDLIAVAWTPEATDAETLVQTICDRTSLFVTVPDKGDKPHGRAAYTLQGLSVRHSWIDLSVIPPKAPSPDPAEARPSVAVMCGLCNQRPATLLIGTPGMPSCGSCAPPFPVGPIRPLTPDQGEGR